jgi:hypothetical protein
MFWTVVPFGKYEGKTLPEIIMRDPDWFLWVLPRLNGKLAKEAGEIARKAQAIKIPKGKKKKLLIEYRYELDTESMMGRRFCGFELVADSAYYCKKWTARSSQSRFDVASPGEEIQQAGWPHHDPGFSASLLWEEQTVDEKAM